MPVLGRNKTGGATKHEPSSNEQLEAENRSPRPGAKNRPTPKRREAEAAKRRPLIETDRKAAAARDREHARQERARQHQAMMAGEEWALLPRDRGAARAFIRDHVDARWNIAEFTMPALIVAMLMSLLVSWVKSPYLVQAVMFLTYGVMILGLVEQTIVYRRIKRQFRTHHPDEEWPARAGFYSGMRAFQLRPTRVPRPRVRRGQYPR